MITVVGSLNVDFFIETERLPAPGETVVGSNFRRAPGGKGANQAVAIARLGEECALIGAVGADAMGEELVMALSAAGVDTTRIIRREDAVTGSAMIVVDARGQNQIVIASGANQSLTPADVQRQIAVFQSSRAVIVQLETSFSVAQTTLSLARLAGCLTLLNPAPAQDGALALLSHCDWVIPNEVEAAGLSGLPWNSGFRAEQAAGVIKKNSKCQNVIITLGERGAWLDTPFFVGRIPSFPVEAIEAVGAGDAFVGAFVTRLVEGAVPQDAARFACAAAALSVTRRGAQSSMPNRVEVETFLESTQPNRLSS